MQPIIIFDLGGVLINLNVERCVSCFRELMGEANLLTVLGLGGDGEGVVSVSVATKQLMADFERGNISSEQFVKEVLCYCYPETTELEVIDAWMSMLAELPQERLDFLHRLKQQGYRLYLLSNGNDLHFNHINAEYRLDTFFEQMFLSQRMHLAKPETAIFAQVESTINPNHQPVVFIDDLEKNRLAAQQSVGWKTCADIENLKTILGL